MPRMCFQWKMSLSPLGSGWAVAEACPDFIPVSYWREYGWHLGSGHAEHQLHYGHTACSQEELLLSWGSFWVAPLAPWVR